MIFRFFLATRKQPVTPGDSQWRRPLPLERTGPAAASPRRQHSSKAPTCGHFFEAVQSFFQKKDGSAILTTAAARHLGKDVNRGDIHSLAVLLIKHGEFYHPCRLELKIDDRQVRFLLNVAVSRAGLVQLETEYHALKRLNRELPLGFLPRVYGMGNVRAPFPMAMFLAQWLDGFCEFHACRLPPGKGPAIAIWDPDGHDTTLAGQQALQVYRRAAAILAAYYNPESFEHIYPWHHAAGDFVVGLKKDSIAVRLISARAYAPLFRRSPNEAHGDFQRLILEALLVFLLQLSMHMRIDRLAGVGDLIWIDDAVVPAMVQGFFGGLTAGCRARAIPPEAMDGFAAFLGAVSTGDLLSLCRQLAEVHLHSDERAIVRPQLENHAALLHAALQTG